MYWYSTEMISGKNGNQGIVLSPLISVQHNFLHAENNKGEMATRDAVSDLFATPAFGYAMAA